MSRSYAAPDLVALPRLAAVSAGRLMKQLLTAAGAEKKKLPKSIAAQRDELVTARAALATELQKRVGAEPPEPPAVRAADIVEDNAFGAFFDWLAAFERLPAEQHPEAAEAAMVRQGMFPTGLAFLAIRTVDEWQEAETRLRLLHDEGWDEIVIKLGGKPFLDELSRAHKAYGEALGITTAKPVPADPPAVRAALDDARAAIRGYVLQVVAQVRPSKPATQELADRLLAPLVEWQEAPAKAKGDKAAAKTPAAPEKPADPKKPADA